VSKFARAASSLDWGVKEGWPMLSCLCY